MSLLATNDHHLKSTCCQVVKLQ